MCGMSGQGLFDISGVINTTRANKQGICVLLHATKGEWSKTVGISLSFHWAAAGMCACTRAQTHSEQTSLQPAEQRRHHWWLTLANACRQNNNTETWRTKEQDKKTKWGRTNLHYFLYEWSHWLKVHENIRPSKPTNRESDNRCCHKGLFINQWFSTGGIKGTSFPNH